MIGRFRFRKIKIRAEYGKVDRRDKRLKAYRAGLWAEFVAALYLRCRGYRILEFRYKSPVGEVDLLAFKKDVLVAVEVKARRDLERAIEAVTPRNRMRVEKSALYFISRYPRYAPYSLRFDIVAVRLRGRFFPSRLRHLDNAWQARS